MREGCVLEEGGGMSAWDAVDEMAEMGQPGARAVAAADGPKIVEIRGGFWIWADFGSVLKVFPRKS